MNPTVPTSFLEREQRRDPENYEREYEATFTEAISSFLPAEAIAECVIPGRAETGPPDTHRHTYLAAIDAAFKGDRFTFCVAHRDIDGSGKVIIDYLTGWQGTRREPVRLRDILPEIQAKCREFEICNVYADQYGSAPIGEALREFDLFLQEVTFTQQSKADIYGTLRTLIVDRKIELLDHSELLKELRQLELELLPGGMARVGHPSRHGAHDDYADVVALTSKQLYEMRIPGIHFGVV
jgi:hypothetical protein